jgi:glutathione S-transferase
MELVYIVILLALAEYEVITFMVGRARDVYNISPPATTGHPKFERIFRIHQNNAEQLIATIPAMLLFGLYVSPYWAAGIGMVFVLARLAYVFIYLKDPKLRIRAYFPGFAATAVLIVGALIGLGMKLH